MSERDERDVYAANHCSEMQTRRDEAKEGKARLRHILHNYSKYVFTLNTTRPTKVKRIFVPADCREIYKEILQGNFTRKFPLVCI